MIYLDYTNQVESKLKASGKSVLKNERN